jgi:23S rRNA pseudouridine1911/1915/1917 synthase
MFFPQDNGMSDHDNLLPPSDILICEAIGGERLDKLLVIEGLSRSRVQALIKQGCAAVNGKICDDLSHKPAAGSIITLNVPPPVAAEPRGQDIPLKVIYEDDDLIIIDKPAGLVVHPASGHEDGTLVNALIAHCGESLSGIGGVKRPGIVHRLDKDTSGLLVVAKNDFAHKGLAAQFADHGRTGPLERMYQALVWGVPLPLSGTIDAPLARNPHHREKIGVTQGEAGRFAITHYQVREQFYDINASPVVSLVQCTLETGRTHQIRVHMAHMGHPLLGDHLYGSGFITKAKKLTSEAQEALSALGRQALHAATLGFVHPRTSEFMDFHSEPPEAWLKLLDSLRKCDNIP